MNNVRDTQDLVALISDARDRRLHLEVRGGGTKADIGRASRQTSLINMSAFSSVIDYEPGELVLTVGAGVPLTEINALLETKGQMLAFEPFDYAPLFGQPAGRSTIGGIIAANVAGSRRLSAGSPRDYLLGFRAVSGRGEAFKAGSKVVKNVTGFDLSKMIAGSWGRLAVLTEATLKVLPRAEQAVSIAIFGLSDEEACGEMNRAMGLFPSITGAAHLPASVSASISMLGQSEATSATVLRIEGFGISVDESAEKLLGYFADKGPCARFVKETSRVLWAHLSSVGPFAQEGTVLWLINAPARQSWGFAQRIQDSKTRYYYDCAGARIWVAAPSTVSATDIRSAVAAIDGAVTLVRAPIDFRAQDTILPPLAGEVSALALRVKEAFDPSMILDPERFERLSR